MSADGGALIPFVPLNVPFVGVTTDNMLGEVKKLVCKQLDIIRVSQKRQWDSGLAEMKKALSEGNSGMEFCQYDTISPRGAKQCIREAKRTWHGVRLCLDHSRQVRNRVGVMEQTRQNVQGSSAAEESLHDARQRRNVSYNAARRIDNVSVPSPQPEQYEAMEETVSHEAMPPVASVSPQASSSQSVDPPFTGVIHSTSNPEHTALVLAQETENCSICQQSLSTGITTTLTCGRHIFHVDCANRWKAACFSRRKDFECPLCRYIVEAYEARVEIIQDDTDMEYEYQSDLEEDWEFEE